MSSYLRHLVRLWAPPRGLIRVRVGLGFERNQNPAKQLGKS
ncbi:MAG: hypothetical protein ORN98_03925 [Alphaproteobacteria bacterium]|nr:hypothetical protein [Alphaproteobacteria bacterium]